MPATISAVFEGGIFRPTEKVDLAEGTHVEVTVQQDEPGWDPKTVAAKLAELAGQSGTTGTVDTASVDHDSVLYSKASHP